MNHIQQEFLDPKPSLSAVRSGITDQSHSKDRTKTHLLSFSAVRKKGNRDRKKWRQAPREGGDHNSASMGICSLARRQTPIRLPDTGVTRHGGVSTAKSTGAPVGDVPGLPAASEKITFAGRATPEFGQR